MPSPLPSLADCFQAGADARARGEALADNPFPPRMAEHREWAAGWRAVLDLDEEDDPASNRLRKEDEMPDPDPDRP